MAISAPYCMHQQSVPAGSMWHAAYGLLGHHSRCMQRHTLRSAFYMGGLTILLLLLLQGSGSSRRQQHLPQQVAARSSARRPQLLLLLRQQHARLAGTRSSSPQQPERLR